MNEVDLILPGRGTVGIIGPNGAGKSTVLDALSGFIRFSGAIRDDECQYGLARRDLRRRFVRLHQVIVLPGEVVLGDYLAISARPSAVRTLVWPRRESGGNRTVSSDPSVLRFLAAAGLEDSVDRPIGDFSWGQKRAVGIAGVLLSPKPYVLLDEPFSGLSQFTADALGEVLREQASERLVVIAEHDLGHLLPLLDMLIVMVGGQVKVVAPPERISTLDLLPFFVEPSGL